ncbi:MAG: dienelactone hydrolase family protein [Planctomycetota bacterium]|jgi:carboxymethylenebutenolidase
MRYGVILVALAAAVGAQDTGLTGVLSEEAFKKLHELSQEKRPPPAGKMIRLKTSRAYLSLPKKGKPPFPAVLVIHEWWGLNQHIKYWADRLAADGYAALAVDLYGGQVATTRDDALKYMKAVDAEKAKAVLKEAHASLATDERVRAKKRACVGWCFGGGWSLQHALQAPDLDGAVIYYGRLVTDPEKLKAIRAPLLGIFGNQDRGIPPKVVNAFEKTLKEAGVKHTILRYDANHAFANPSSGRYAAKAAEDAWRKVRVFLAARLKGQTGR